ncbi:hypothetical protein Tco_1312343 [Tanacetum coccineum]
MLMVYSSLTSSDNSVIFEGSYFSSVGKQLAKSCGAKSLDSSGMKSLGADILGSDSVVKSTEASHLDADSK